jgi:hypothetical protein
VDVIARAGSCHRTLYRAATSVTLIRRPSRSATSALAG